MVALRTSGMFAGRRVLRPTVVNVAVQTASIAADAFPAPIKLGRYSRWSQAEIQGWVEMQKAARRAA